MIGETDHRHVGVQVNSDHFLVLTISKKAFPKFFFSKSKPKMERRIIVMYYLTMTCYSVLGFFMKRANSPSLKFFRAGQVPSCCVSNFFKGSAWPLADYDYKMCSSLLLFGSSAYVDHYQTSKTMGLFKRFSIFPKSSSSSVASAQAKSAQAKSSKKSSKDSSKEVEVKSYFPTYPVLSMHIRRM